MCIVCCDTGFTEDFLGMNAPTRCTYCTNARYKAIDTAKEVTRFKIEQLEKELSLLRSKLID